jgi:hypothetical protein
MSITYEQARQDHEYLWSIAPAFDMTGGYVDGEDLQKLLRSPNKITARKCYSAQINYWFQVGPDTLAGGPGAIPWDDPKVKEIAERHGCA